MYEQDIMARAEVPMDGRPPETQHAIMQLSENVTYLADRLSVLAERTAFVRADKPGNPEVAEKSMDFQAPVAQEIQNQARRVSRLTDQLNTIIDGLEI
jgi:hypothetical protein